MRAPAVALVLLAAALAGCAQEPPAGTPRPEAGFNPIVLLATDLGDVYIEVFVEMVPITAHNFLAYVENRFYEGVKVHRVVGPAAQPPDGFVVQLGDPTTRDPTTPREAWGGGDPRLPRIPDELHPGLRHDMPGVVSMANSGPNTGTSQFFITLAPAPWLDDKYAVFGRVVAGMETVRRIADVPTDAGQRPLEDIVVRRTAVIEPARDPEEVVHRLEAWSFFPAWNATANRTLQLGVVVRNAGNVRDAVETRVDAPPGWIGERVQPLDNNVSAGASSLFLFWVKPPANAAEGEHRVLLRFRAEGTAAEASLPLTVRVRELGAEARTGSRVTLHYVGTLLDGRLFDTSLRDVATNASLPRLAGEFRPREPGQYEPLSFEVGGGQVLAGFSNGTRGLREGESATFFLFPEQAYGARCPPAPQECRLLVGREVAFTVEVLDVS